MRLFPDRHVEFFFCSQEVALVSLANVLYRMGHESDATAVMQHSLEVSKNKFCYSLAIIAPRILLSCVL